MTRFRGSRPISRFLLSFRNRHQHDPELRAHSISFGEDLHHQVWRRVRSHVVVSGFAAEQQIAHTPADEVSLVPMLAQGTNNSGGKLAHCLMIQTGIATRVARTSANRNPSQSTARSG